MERAGPVTRLGPVRKALLVAGLAILSLAALELSFRVYLWIAGRPATPEAIRTEIRELGASVAELTPQTADAEELPLLPRRVVQL